MSRSLRILAALLMLAMPPCLMACGTSSPAPPPLIQTQVIKVMPPPGLLEDIPPPDLPARLQSRDDIDAVTLGLAGWGKQLRNRLAELRGWSTAAPDR